METVHEIFYPCKFDHTRQPAMCQPATGTQPRPLVVALHTWSGDHTQATYREFAALAAERNWHMIFPAFRGPNWNPDGCGSDLVVSDMEDAVSYMKENYAVDPDRIYLTGGSGGGHCSLLLAGRRPDLWSAVSSWCPISDIALWCKQSFILKTEYGNHIITACGGDPAESSAALREARLRSPLTWLSNAHGLRVDISTGIHDGHTGSVPVGQAIRAYNQLADAADRISEEDIAYIEKNEAIPAHLSEHEEDPAYGKCVVHMRKQSGNVRLTLFEGGHDMLPKTAFEWLGRQSADQQPDWKPGRPIEQDGSATLFR